MVGGILDGTEGGRIDEFRRRGLMAFCGSLLAYLETPVKELLDKAAEDGRACSLLGRLAHTTEKTAILAFMRAKTEVELLGTGSVELWNELLKAVRADALVTDHYLLRLLEHAPRELRDQQLRNETPVAALPPQHDDDGLNEAAVLGKRRLVSVYLDAEPLASLRERAQLERTEIGNLIRKYVDAGLARPSDAVSREGRPRVRRSLKLSSSAQLRLSNRAASQQMSPSDLLNAILRTELPNVPHATTGYEDDGTLILQSYHLEADLDEELGRQCGVMGVTKGTLFRQLLARGLGMPSDD